MNDASQIPASGLVVVAVLTYKRNELLDRLLDSYAAMENPVSYRHLLVVIDNDPFGSARQIVELRQSGPCDVRYFHESRRGIPIARNRALDEALSLKADALCFIDDDERPDPLWLNRLITCWQKTGAHLVGGPVEVATPPDVASVWQRAINASLAARMRRKNRMTAQRAATGGRYTVVTNNWLCDLGWQRRSGVRFDERMLISGGSDTAFYRAARAAGAKPAWCSDAIVYETMELERLSLTYQFVRGAAQSNTHFVMKRLNISIPLATASLLFFAIRLVLALFLLVIPIFGLASPVMAVRSLGWSVGRMQALFGQRSALYK
ncbi:glycosyltransferase family 2 protein [Mesorhizobium sp. 10J20-29]